MPEGRRQQELHRSGDAGHDRRAERAVHRLAVGSSACDARHEHGLGHDERSSTTTHPTLSINDAPAVDEGGAATFTVEPGSSRSHGGHRQLRRPRTALRSRLATTPPGRRRQLTFAPGETSKDGDGADARRGAAARREQRELHRDAVRAVGKRIDRDGTGTGTINDDDPEPTIASISDATVVEGNTGTVDATITVTLSAPSGKTVTVPFLTSPGHSDRGRGLRGPERQRRLQPRADEPGRS